MPGQHSNPTIAFRPTRWEQTMIEERVKASGLYKKDFIHRSAVGWDAGSVHQHWTDW